MPKIYSEIELDEMCRKRPPGYREDMLAVSTKRTDGGYELDPMSEAYRKMKEKYAPIKVLARLAPEQRKPLVAVNKERMRTRPSTQSMLQTVQWESLCGRADELKPVLGASSAFAFAYVNFLEQEKRGRCRGCSRNAELKKLAEAFKMSLLAASDENKLKVREMFKETVFIELVPQPLKWDDIIRPIVDNAATHAILTET